MIHYSLICDNAHEFEGWFSKSEDFDAQRKSGFLACPTCNSDDVSKVLMAPAISTARNKEARHAMVAGNAQREMLAKVKEVVASIRASSEDVGERFPEEARKIHYGEAEARGIIGQASPMEVKSLLEEGVEIAPLPILPEDAN